jgi:hypothetical protein
LHRTVDPHGLLGVLRHAVDPLGQRVDYRFGLLDYLLEMAERLIALHDESRREQTAWRLT